MIFPQGWAATGESCGFGCGEEGASCVRTNAPVWAKQSSANQRSAHVMWSAPAARLFCCHAIHRVLPSFFSTIKVLNATIVDHPVIDDGYDVLLVMIASIMGSLVPSSMCRCCMMLLFWRALGIVGWYRQHIFGGIGSNHQPINHRKKGVTWNDTTWASGSYKPQIDSTTHREWTREKHIQFHESVPWSPRATGFWPTTVWGGTFPKNPQTKKPKFLTFHPISDLPESLGCHRGWLTRSTHHCWNCSFPRQRQMHMSGVPAMDHPCWPCHLLLAMRLAMLLTSCFWAWVVGH